MPYFLFDGTLSEQQHACLEGKEAQHLLYSRRVRVGEIFEVQDQEGKRFQAVLEKANKMQAWFRTITQIITPNDSQCHISIVQALIKEKSIEWLIQKATELGVAEIIFFPSQFSAKAISAQKQEHLITRYQTIAQEACKQCGRVFPPQIQYEKQFTTLLSNSPSRQWCLYPHENAISFKEIPTSEQIEKVRFYIGPEGGWSVEEIKTFIQYQVSFLSLGTRILRAETATISMIALMQAMFGDLQKV